MEKQSVYAERVTNALAQRISKKRQRRQIHRHIAMGKLGIQRTRKLGLKRKNKKMKVVAYARML